MNNQSLREQGREEAREIMKRIDTEVREKHRKIQEGYKKQAEELGQQKRQEILDMIKSGKTLGEVSTHFNIDLMVTCEILTQNIQSASWLRSESK